jgi:glutaredoxin
LSTITVFSHTDCHLCERALEVLCELGAHHAFELRVVDVRADDDLHRRYFERVPVIELDGEEVCELSVDEPALRARLQAATGTGARSAGPPRPHSGAIV